MADMLLHKSFALLGAIFQDDEMSTVEALPPENLFFGSQVVIPETDYIQLHAWQKKLLQGAGTLRACP